LRGLEAARLSYSSSRRTRCPRLAIAVLCATHASSWRRPLAETRAARAAGGAVTAAAAKQASPEDAISQSSYDTGQAALLSTLKQQNDTIAGIADEAYHQAEGIRIVLRDAAAALRRHPIMLASA